LWPATAASDSDTLTNTNLRRPPNKRRKEVFFCRPEPESGPEPGAGSEGLPWPRPQKADPVLGLCFRRDSVVLVPGAGHGGDSADERGGGRR
jgi:hypothetical protein